jgi:imidazolonepropionase-like amidohydrolase
MVHLSEQISAVVLVLTPLVACGPTPSPNDSSNTFVIRNVRIFDGERVIPEREVVVSNGAITTVGSDGQTPSNVRVVDGEGGTLLPGLIDSHTHSPMPILMRQAAAFGVTTQLDMYSDPSMVAAARQFLGSAEGQSAADLRAAGLGVTAPGGHGTEYGGAVPTLAPDADPVAFVDALVADGADYIKIIHDDGSVLGTKFNTLTAKMIAESVAAAHRRGKLGVVHVTTLDAARDALDAKADGLVHVFIDKLPTREFVDRSAEARLFVVPTLTLWRDGEANRQSRTELLGEPFGSYLSGFGRSRVLAAPDRASADYENARETVRLLHWRGVRILAGTDADNPGTTNGASIHRELVLLHEAGLSPIDALKAATAAPADAFGLLDRGRIRPGLRADLLLVAGDPTAEVSATRQISRVWKAGVEIDREAFRDVAGTNRQIWDAVDRGRAHDAVEAFDRHMKLHPGQSPISEPELNMVGYELLRAGRVDDAIVIFELQVRQHPDSWNAWDSLGEGYMRRGDIKSAVDHYEHSLKLNPANSNGVRMLEKLRGK